MFRGGPMPVVCESVDEVAPIIPACHVIADCMTTYNVSYYGIIFIVLLIYKKNKKGY